MTNNQDPTLRKKILIPVIILVILSLCTFLLWFLLIQPLANVSAPDISISSVDPSPIVDQIEDNSQRLAYAKQILDQFTQYRSEEGFYGDYQACQLDTQTCDTILFNTTNPKATDSAIIRRASWRQNVPIAWARFKYWQKTNDSEQLALMKEDLQNLVTHILDSGYWTLQTDTFNCSLLSEIAKSPSIDAETKNLAQRLCLESSFEYHPNSDLSYDQHNHALLAFSSSNPDQEKNYWVHSNSAKHRAPNQLHQYQTSTIQKSITSNLEKLANNQSQDYLGSISLVQQQAFIERELIAAIDQNSMIQLAQVQSNQDLADQATLHYLLLTGETLAWYNQDVTQFANLDTCLMSSNLDLYLRNYPQTLTQATSTRLTRYLNYHLNDLNDLVLCDLSQYLSTQKTPDFKPIIEKIINSQINPASHFIGSFDRTYTDNQIAYWVKENALLAGLLSL